MQLLQRRVFLGAAALLPAVLVSEPAEATLLRGLPLPALVAESDHALLLTALDSQCTYVRIAGQRRIATETRLRVEDIVAKASPNQTELVVRTLGGVLDGVGELVHGQAELALNSLCLLFLTRGADGSLWVTGMAQGHYPIAGLAAGNPYLLSSPHLPTIRDFEQSAVRALVGQNLPDARRLVSEAGSR